MRLLVLAMDNTNYGSRSHEILCTERLAGKVDKLVCCAERMPQYPESERMPENMKIIPMPLNEGISEKHNQQILEEGPFDAIFTTSISGAILAAQLKHRHGWYWVAQILDIPMWRLQYDQWKPQWEYWLSYVHTADHIIVNAKVVKTNLEYLFQLMFPGEGNPPIRVVYYGMNTELADSVPEPEKRDRIISASRHVFYKGFDLLLYGYKIYLETNSEPLGLDIIGTGEETAKLQQMAQLLNLPQVRFLGALSDKEKFNALKRGICAVSCEFAPDIPQLFPLEAIYCNMPTVVNDMEMTRELFGEYAVFTNVYRTDELAGWMNFLPNEYPSEAGKKWIKENRTIQHHANGILATLGEVVK